MCREAQKLNGLQAGYKFAPPFDSPEISGLNLKDHVWAGRSIVEVGAAEPAASAGVRIPFVRFQARELMTIEEVNQAAKALLEKINNGLGRQDG